MNQTFPFCFFVHTFVPDKGTNGDAANASHVTYTLFIYMTILFISLA